jgi:protein-tyrosine phosphatase
MNASVSQTRGARERVLSLQGGCNFRDIGGYRTLDGRTVRWGQVYRAGVLSYFTDGDHGSLTELQVRSICDLRRAEEREREPTRWPGSAVPQLLQSEDGISPPMIRSFAAKRPSTAAGMFDAMIDLYRVLPVWMASRVRSMFECIANGAVPLVVHCAAGKDRTGVAIAVLLRSLGVPTQTVLEDYLLTNDTGDFEAFIRSRQVAQLGLTDAHHPLLSMPEDVRRVLFSAETAFLDAALETIERDWGSIEQYLQASGVSVAMREKVTAAMLD